MEIKDIRIENIELADERFRIAHFFSLDPLVLSIKKIGLIYPPVVTPRSGRLVIVTGWKRVLACRKIHFSSLPVFVLDEPEDSKAFRLSFLENLTVRNFSLLEKAEVIGKLSEFGEGEREIIKTCLPLLHIPPTYDYYNLYMNIFRWELKEKELIHFQNVSLAVIERLVEITSDERAVLYPYLWPLSVNKQKELLEVIQELSLKKGLSLREILESGNLKAVAEAENLSALQKSDRIRKLLQNIRFPKLSKRQGDFASAKKRMAWPEDIKISPTPFFEDKTLHIEFSFQSPKDYLEKLSVLHEAAALKDFAELFDISEDD